MEGEISSCTDGLLFTLEKEEKGGQFPPVPELASKTIKGRDLAWSSGYEVGNPWRWGSGEVKCLGHVIIFHQAFPLNY
jgi:hypothetical protein